MELTKGGQGSSNSWGCCSQGKLRGLSLKQAARFLIMSKEGVRSLHAANELLQEIRSQLSEPA